MRTPERPSLGDCPQRDKHTPAPDGYMQWHAWAHRMAVGHRQVRCRGCKRYAIWVVKGTNKRPMDPVVPEQGCLTCRGV